MSQTKPNTFMAFTIVMVTYIPLAKAVHTVKPNTNGERVRVCMWRAYSLPVPTYHKDHMGE